MTVVHVVKTCVVCDKEYVVDADYEKYERWRTGELIQNVWPELSAAQREQLISGVCSDECWTDLWSTND